MQMGLNGIKDCEKEIEDAKNYPGLRLATVRALLPS